MVRDSDDLWHELLHSGEVTATEEDYEHGYKREVRQDLQQYVAFRVIDEVYGLPINDIEEISKVFGTTPVPRTPDFLLGIGNVRGNVIPVIALSLRLRLGTFVPARSSRVLIVKHAGELHGLVVDEVLEVVAIAPEELEDAPGAIGGTRGEFIKALARYQQKILIILDFTTLLDPDEFVARRRVGERGAR